MQEPRPRAVAGPVSAEGVGGSHQGGESRLGRFGEEARQPYRGREDGGHRATRGERAGRTGQEGQQRRGQQGRAGQQQRQDQPQQHRADPHERQVVGAAADRLAVDAGQVEPQPEALALGAGEAVGDLGDDLVGGARPRPARRSWYIHGLNQTVGRQPPEADSTGAGSPSAALAAARDLGVRDAFPLRPPGRSRAISRISRDGGRAGSDRGSRSSAGVPGRRAGGRAAPRIIRISEVLPVPHGPLTPIVSGGRVSAWRMNAAMASASDAVAEMVVDGPPVGGQPGPGPGSPCAGPASAAARPGGSPSRPGRGGPGRSRSRPGG